MLTTLITIGKSIMASKTAFLIILIGLAVTFGTVYKIKYNNLYDEHIVASAQLSSANKEIERGNKLDEKLTDITNRITTNTRSQSEALLSFSERLKDVQDSTKCVDSDAIRALRDELQQPARTPSAPVR